MNRCPQSRLQSALLMSTCVAILAMPVAAGPSAGEAVTGDPAVTPGTTVVLPAGSADGLAAAIDAAGPGGTVIVEAGPHSESGPVTIGIPVVILGEPEAVIESVTSPSRARPLVVDPALHVQGAEGVVIQGLTLRPPAGSAGGCAVLVEDAPGATVEGNTITGYQFAVLVQRGDGSRISNNTLSIARGDASGPFPAEHGVVVINGSGVAVVGNTISGATFGIWASGADGLADGNDVSRSLAGVILFRVPEGNLSISGDASGSAASATNWDVRDNVSTGNFWGYLVIDGSSQSRFWRNAASGNLASDIELAGDSFRFGFLTPSSFDTTIYVGAQHDLVIKDCGRDDRILGAANLVDTTANPCN